MVQGAILLEPLILMTAHAEDIIEADFGEEKLHRAGAVHAAFRTMITAKLIGETEPRDVLATGQDHRDQLHHFRQWLRIPEEKAARLHFFAGKFPTGPGECAVRFRKDSEECPGGTRRGRRGACLFLLAAEKPCFSRRRAESKGDQKDEAD